MNNLDRRQRPYFLRVILIWFAAWVLVGTTLLAGRFGPLFGPIEDFIFIALAATLVFWDLMRRLGLPGAIKAFFWVAVVSAAIETLGARTGFPFGEYRYTDRFGPRLGEVLPLAIPLAWFVLIMPVYLSLELKLARSVAGAAFLCLVTGFILMLIDFGLEPVATLARGYWLWTPDQPASFYYGVPLRNFVAWWATGAIIALGLRVLLREPRLRPPPGRRFPTLPFVVLLGVLVTFLGAAAGAGLWPAALLLAGLVVFFTLWLLAGSPRPLSVLWRLWKGLPVAPGLG